MPNRFSGINTAGDYQREEEEFNMRKQKQAQEIALGQAKLDNPSGGIDAPSSVREAKHLEDLLANKQFDAANRYMALKRSGAYGVDSYGNTVNQGIVPEQPEFTPDGQPMDLPQGVTPFIPQGPSIAEQQAANAGLKSAAMERAKLQEQFALKGDIAGDVGQKQADVDLRMQPRISAADIEAKDKAAKTIELGERASKMPELESTLADLEGYADDATYTLGGQARDFAAKEIFGMDTEGATARVGFDTTVSNQILPLLRQTFGAAFTAKEGDSLRATLGNVDATPSQKRTAIHVFLKQAKRNINSRERELGFTLTDWAGGGVANPQVLATFENKKTQPNTPKRGTKVDGYWFMGGNPADENNYQKVK